MLMIEKLISTNKLRFAIFNALLLAFCFYFGSFQTVLYAPGKLAPTNIKIKAKISQKKLKKVIKFDKKCKTFECFCALCRIPDPKK